MFDQAPLPGGPLYTHTELNRVPGLVYAVTGRRLSLPVKDAAKRAKVAFKPNRGGLRGLNIDPQRLVFLRQVHSNRFVLHRPGLQEPEVDGILLLQPGWYSVIRTADCVPVTVFDAETQVVGVFHAGWRGLRSRLIEDGVGQLVRKNGRPGQSLQAVIGPAIRSCCYQVGPELKKAYQGAGHPIDRLFSKDRLDLVAAAQLQLAANGIERVFDCGVCTACRRDLFYSYRSERTTARTWTIAGFREVSSF